jgi:hypothetical protein
MMSASAQESGKHPPRFEDFPVAEKWNQAPALVKLTTPSDRMFRTRLTNAAKVPPNFAGHYSIAIWGCGSNCISGAVVDLQTGTVMSPPLATSAAHFSICQSAYENSGVDYRLDSRLMIVRCGLNYSERLDRNIPDNYYLVLEDNHFRQLLHLSGRQAAQ